MKVIRRFGFAILLVAIATAVQRELWPFLPPSPHLFFFPAIVFVAWKEGFWPAILASLLAAASISFFFLDPPMSFAVASTEDKADLSVFLALAGALSWLVARSRSLEATARLASENMKELEMLRTQWNAVVAHDLRTPLGVILMSAGALRITPNPAHIDRIERATRRLDRIVRDLLDSARLEVHQLPLVKADVDLGEVVGECVAEQEQEGIILTVEGELPHVTADRERIEQAIENLLTNACKYRTPGTDVAVAVSRAAAGLEVSVTNRGAGIAAAELSLLFLRFRRTSEAERGSVRGIGVGLYIAKGLADAHGGTLECDSVPGDRTTFRLWLPFRAAPRTR